MATSSGVGGDGDPSSNLDMSNEDIVADLTRDFENDLYLSAAQTGAAQNGNIEQCPEEAVSQNDDENEKTSDEIRAAEEQILSEDEKETRKEEAMSTRKEGNEHFKSGEYFEAVQLYTQALNRCPKCYTVERSILFGNRAACHFKTETFENALEDCNQSLELDPEYLKVVLRRAQTYEKLEKLDEALADYQNVLEKDRSSYYAREAVMRLPDQINERNEKMKEEMMGKLKDLGNLILRPFGLSTNNFNLQQDMNTGGYNIQFSQTPKENNNDS